MDRQQKVKEALYLFLLQKREENELSQAFTAYNTRIICHPMGLDTPTSPVASTIYFVAFILALFLPTGILYLKELLYTKVRGRKDIEILSAPFVGEIPLTKTIAKTKTKTNNALVVEQGNRDVINEAFRIVRSNLNFMLNPNSAASRKVVLITSLTPNSGKTFISLNLASSFVFQKDTKVAVIDLDIRKATLSDYIKDNCLENSVGKEGVADYLAGFKDDWHELMVPFVDGNKTSPLLGKCRGDVLPVGHIPPNPAELLQSERLAKLLEEMKQEYDLIFLDMPPVEAVADVTIVKHYADLTLFIIRTGALDRQMLPVVENYYKEGTFNNLSILLNGTEQQHLRYGYSRYGYGNYGYSK